MPIYEFTCTKCKSDFEELVFNRNEKVKCPDCGSGKVDRAMSVFAYSSGGSFRSGSDSCGSCSSGSCSSCNCGGH